MMKNKKYSWRLLSFIALVAVVIIFTVVFFLIHKWNRGEDVDGILWWSGSILTRESFLDGCNALTGVKSVSLATPDSRFYTSSEATPSKSPTKKIKINWDLWNIFLCVVPDISDKKPHYEKFRIHWFNTNTVLKIWNFAWHYDVWYSLSSHQLYDYDGNNSSPVKTKMFWKYYLDELPLYQIIDLQSSIIFADLNKWWVQRVNLRDKFQSWSVISVWWYMNIVGSDRFYVSSIREFKILWDWEWSIEVL